MSKRSEFKRRKNDAYFTPLKPVEPLIPHLYPGTSFIEPCAGDGRLARHLDGFGIKCKSAIDVDPQGDGIRVGDALTHDFDVSGVDYFITNPPWTREILHPLIERLRQIRPTWLLFDADWMHTRQASPYLPFCHKIVSVGRVKWIEDSEHFGKDNAAWYLFGRDRGAREFIGLTGK